MRTTPEKVTWPLAGAAVMTLLAVLTGLGQVHLIVGVALLIGVLLFIGTAQPRLVLLLTGVFVVTPPTAWPRVGQLGEATIHVSDVLLVLLAFASLIHPRRRRPTPVLKVLGVFLLLGVFRSSLGEGPGSTASFLRVVEPVVAGAAVGLLLPRDCDVWRTVRWALFGVLAAVPLFGETFPRWYGLPGGPNEVALVAAVLVVLGVAESNKGLKILFFCGGMVGLIGSKGILASAGALAGVTVLSLARRSHSREARTSRINPWTIVGAMVCAGWAIPLLRPDMAVTFQIHATQAQSFWPTMAATNPLFGGGWTTADRDALMSTYLQTHIYGLHNVYLDVAAFLGVFGLFTFLLLLWRAWRNSDRLTRAVLATVAVWFNTTGAFPGVGWGILGLVVAATVGHVPADRQSFLPLAKAPTVSSRSRVPWSAVRTPQPCPGTRTAHAD
ncbi:hypothetical protein [Streptomyces sp. NPDC050263]|uniref:hypothetical protein n=1 Tax=Streptomyces sp. NPDC050263 TaxID=3155037 RepID=UPI003429B0E1